MSASDPHTPETSAEPPRSPVGGPPPYPAAGGRPPYPQPYAHTVGTPSPRRNVAGLVALSLGLLLVLWTLVGAVLQVQAIAGGGTAAVSAVGLLSGVVNVVLALTAIGFGIAGAVARDRPRLAAGIGLGLGIGALAGVATGALYPVLFTLFGI